jgi:uncharacterized protein (DUF427 family)
VSQRILDMLLPQMRHEPARRRVRATLDGEAVVDSTRALLVWEPWRILPAYAVPQEHVRGPLRRASVTAAAAALPGPRRSSGQLLDPSVPFAVHTAEGEPLSLRHRGHDHHGVAFRPAAAELEGYVLLDFEGFDAWYEERDRVVGHTRDLLHRIEIQASSRTVRVERDGALLAESADALLLFEHPVLPVRAYLPPADIRIPLRPSPTRTRCPYKGEASYWSLDLNGQTIDDLAWSYEAPLEEAARVAGRICFFDEHVNVSLDGEPQPQPRTGWS